MLDLERWNDGKRNNYHIIDDSRVQRTHCADLHTGTLAFEPGGDQQKIAGECQEWHIADMPGELKAESKKRHGNLCKLFIVAFENWI